MSRICVKNLSSAVTEDILRSHFSSKGEVTDCKIVKTKNGKNRRFAFIGFRSNDQATEAIRYFNNTYVLTNKVGVESAVKIGDEEIMQKSRSRYTQQKVKKIQKEVEKERSENQFERKKVIVDHNSKKPVDKRKLDFLEAMKARRNAKFWGNDESVPTTHHHQQQQGDEEDVRIRSKEVPEVDDDDSENNEDSDEDVNDLFTQDSSSVFIGHEEDGAMVEKNEQDVVDDTHKIIDEHVSDMDYLRSKIKQSDKSKEKSTSPEVITKEKNGMKVKKDVAKIGTVVDSSRTDKKRDEVGVADVKEQATADDITSTVELAKMTKQTQRNQYDDDDDADATEKDEDRLFIRNLPYLCNEDELRDLFASYGMVTSVHIPLNEDKRCKGFGFVQFMLPEQADKALRETDGTSFQGRLLHVIKAKRVPEKIEGETEMQLSQQVQGKGRLSAYQVQREEERKKQINKKDGWNSSFVRSDTVIESLADRYGVSRSEILDTTQGGGELAIRMAVGETHILQENKEFFLSNGVDLNALESSASSRKAGARSTTTILIKNLPHDLIPEEIQDMFAKYGQLSSFLVPPSKTLALLDFVEPSEARAAFKGLAYRKYKHVPLYLEWAPQGIISSAATTTVATNKSNSLASTGVTTKSLSELKVPTIAAPDLPTDDDYSSLFIKNLNFQTTEEALQLHVSNLACAGLRVISIPKKKKGDAVLSMGYGFAEFRSTELANIGLQKLHSSVLDGHSLEVKPSDKRISSTTQAVPQNKRLIGDVNETNTKLIVRNVAFQASTKEIKSLFSSFGSVKRVRIPKKLGNVHRGFAFVDFSSAQEASAAMNSLVNTHLYGRHLVLEWAKEDDEDVQQLRKKAKVDVASIQKLSSSSSSKTGSGSGKIDDVLNKKIDGDINSRQTASINLSDDEEGDEGDEE